MLAALICLGFFDPEVQENMQSEFLIKMDLGIP